MPDLANYEVFQNDERGLGTAINGILRALLASGAVKNNLAASAAPVATDDETDGYEPGSLWVDVTGDKAYVCVDATEDTAVWVALGAGAGDMLKATYDADDNGIVDDSESTRALYTWPLASNAEPPDGAGLVFDGAAKTWKVTAPGGAAFGNFYGEDAANHSGLDYAYFGGLVRDDNAVSTTADGTVTLADDDTSYVEVDPATGVVSANTTGFTAGSIPLAEVVTASGAITSVADKRTWAGNGPAGGSGGAFTDLTDAPASYTGYALHLLRVNAGETALEFVGRVWTLTPSDSIQDAIDAAAAGDVLVLTPGTYTLTARVDVDTQVAIVALAPGTVSIEAAGPITGSSTNSLFYVTSAGSVFVNLGITITDAQATPNLLRAFYVEAADVIIAGCDISVTADGYVDGICLSGLGVSTTGVRVERCRVTARTAGLVTPGWASALTALLTAETSAAALTATDCELTGENTGTSAVAGIGAQVFRNSGGGAASDRTITLVRCRCTGLATGGGSAIGYGVRANGIYGVITVDVCSVSGDTYDLIQANSATLTLRAAWLANGTDSGTITDSGEWRPGGAITETDPVVGAIDGIVVADGAGNISALSPETVDESDVTITNASAVTAFDANDTTVNEIADYVAQVDTKLDAVIAALQTLGIFEATP